MADLKTEISKLGTCIEIMEKIQRGSYHVFYDGWCFTGGRDIGDSLCFDIKNDSNQIVGGLSHTDSAGYMDGEVTIRMMDPCFSGNEWYNSCSPAIYFLVKTTVYDAVKRDDKEICRHLCGKNGVLSFSRDFCDIYREDVLSGRYDMSDGSDNCDQPENSDADDGPF